ncbi:MAG: ABC-type transport auxiliary lipoprotein family protein [Pseudomonadota bacterium]
MHTHQLARIGLLLLLTGTLGACGSGPAPSRYVLPAPVVVDKPPVTDVRISLTEVRLPGYARNAAISTLRPDGTVEESADHEWASPPVEAVSAVFARLLAAETGATVMQRPTPAAYRPNVRVAVVFDVFARDAQGNAVMEGQFTVEHADRAFVVQRFAIANATETKSYASYMQATSDGLAALATRIAVAIKPTG